MKPSTRATHPTRSFRRMVGALLDGKYVLCRARSLGEKVVELHSQTPFYEGQMSLLNIPLSHKAIIITRAQVVEVVQSGSLYKVKLEFSNSSFQVKRTIRSFVANKLHAD